MELTLKITVRYDGTAFVGWQVQPGQRTVQGMIQQTLSELFGSPVTIHGSGRTDAGVHALGQVFHCRCVSPVPVDRLVRAANSRLPQDIAFLNAEVMPESFHARFDVVEKTYRYRILNGPVRDPLRRNQVWHVPEPLDQARMAEGMALLTGTHDFLGFSATGSPRENTVRTLSRAELIPAEDELWLEFTADGFLYHMVRNLAGTLVEIGLGRWAPDRITEVLALRNRALAGKTAPGHGLYLKSVRYPEE